MPVFSPKVFNSLEYGSQSIPFDDPDIVNFLNPDGTNKYVSADTALQNSDIYSIIMQLSGDLSSVDLKADRKRTQGILNNPSVTSNAHSFWQSMYAQLLLGGECFAYRWRNINGVDLRWEYLRPSQVDPFLLEDGSGLIYNISFDEPQIGVVQAVPQSDVIHIRLLSKNGGMTGISPLSALTNELDIKDQSDRLTLSALKQSVISPGVLKVAKGGLLDVKQKAARSKEFMKQVRSSDNGPIIIDDLEEYKPLEVKSNVAQLLNQVNWTSTQIAKVYGVPDSYLNGKGDQQSSLDMSSKFYVNAIKRYMRSILSELNNKLHAEIFANIRSVVDPFGDSYANTLSTLSKNGTIAQNQASYILQQTGYFPEDMPEPMNTNPVKGGDSDDKENSDQG